MDDTTAPEDTALERYCKMEKGDFVGRAALASHFSATTRIGIKVLDRGIAREHCDIYDEAGQKVGHTTSGTFLPTLDGAYAMAIVQRQVSQPGTKLFVDVRGRRLAAEAVTLPFYHK